MRAEAGSLHPQLAATSGTATTGTAIQHHHESSISSSTASSPHFAAGEVLVQLLDRVREHVGVLQRAHDDSSVGAHGPARHKEGDGMLGRLEARHLPQHARTLTHAWASA